MYRRLWASIVRAGVTAAIMGHESSTGKYLILKHSRPVAEPPTFLWLSIGLEPLLFKV